MHANYMCLEQLCVLVEIEEKGFLDEYSNILHGTDLIEAFWDECIRENDITLLFSIDGAQLYAKKVSSCWIYIWVLFNLSPARHYKKKHVFISGFIPGPNNLKNTDLFLFSGLQHLIGLQREKLKIWDTSLQCKVHFRVFLALLTTDEPGIMHVAGFTEYHGKHGCRLYCDMAEGHEAHGKQYFPAILKLLNYEVEGCMHADIDIQHLPLPSHECYINKLCHLISSPNETQYCA